MPKSSAVVRQSLFASFVLASAACGGSEPGDPFLSGAGGVLGSTSGDGGTATADPGGSTTGTGAEEESGASTEPSAAGSTSSNSSTGGVDAPTGSTTEESALPFSLDEVIWLYPDVSDWPETVVLSSIATEGDQLCLAHDIAQQDPAWPTVLAFETTEVVGNAWVFIEAEGQWYAATWEWLRPPGQTCKAMTSVAGDHIKVEPFGETSGWVPTSGQRYYFMVSGLIRNPRYANVSERSNIVEFVWP